MLMPFGADACGHEFRQGEPDADSGADGIEGHEGEEGECNEHPGAMARQWGNECIVDSERRGAGGVKVSELDWRRRRRLCWRAQQFRGR